ncbi:MAG TPA: hypothetical protein VIU40_02090 [Geobacteraceae bacterium]
MAIQVIKKGFKEGVADDLLLENLIDSKKIIAFRRASGWVIVGKDPVREKHMPYAGTERRRVIQGENFSMK